MYQTLLELAILVSSSASPHSKAAKAFIASPITDKSEETLPSGSCLEIPAAI